MMTELQVSFCICQGAEIEILNCHIKLNSGAPNDNFRIQKCDEERNNKNYLFRKNVSLRLKFFVYTTTHT